MNQFPQTRESVVRELKESEESAAQLILGVSSVQGNWQPMEGKSWSIWQCLEHLVLTNQLYTAALKEAVTKNDKGGESPTKEISPGWFGRWFLSQLEPPVRVRVKTRAKAKPVASGDLEDVQSKFVNSHEEAREVLKYWECVDFNRIKYRNPYASWLRFSVGTGLLILNAHDRRHLWQAQKVKEAPGYPKVQRQPADGI